jgi:hypothetical protein
MKIYYSDEFKDIIRKEYGEDSDEYMLCKDNNYSLVVNLMNSLNEALDILELTRESYVAGLTDSKDFKDKIKNYEKYSNIYDKWLNELQERSNLQGEFKEI